MGFSRAGIGVFVVAALGFLGAGNGVFAVAALVFFVVAASGRVDPLRTLAMGGRSGLASRVSRQFKSRSLANRQLDDLVRYDI